MNQAEQVAFLDEVRVAAERRLEECEREVGLARELAERGEEDEVERRRRKLLTRTERYRSLVRRLDREAVGARRERFETLDGTDRPRILALAVKLHRRARRLETALDRTREQYRGLRMRHLALEREERELADLLGETLPGREEPPEIRANLGVYRSPDEEA